MKNALNKIATSLRCPAQVAWKCFDKEFLHTSQVLKVPNKIDETTTSSKISDVESLTLDQVENVPLEGKIERKPNKKGVIDREEPMVFLSLNCSLASSTKTVMDHIENLSKMSMNDKLNVDVNCPEDFWTKMSTVINFTKAELLEIKNLDIAEEKLFQISMFKHMKKSEGKDLAKRLRAFYQMCVKYAAAKSGLYSVYTDVPRNSFILPKGDKDQWVNLVGTIIFVNGVKCAEIVELSHKKELTKAIEEKKPDWFHKDMKEQDLHVTYTTFFGLKLFRQLTYVSKVYLIMCKCF